MDRSRVVAVVVKVISAVAVVAAVAGACDRHVYGRDDLDVSLFQHHNNLRWGRLENASLTVKPEMRGAFMTTWAARMLQFELQDVEVAGVSIAPDGDSADVVVTVTYVDKGTMTVKTGTFNEHWLRTDAGWLADKFADVAAGG